MRQKKKFRVSTTLHLETKYYFSLNLNFKLRSLLGAIRNSSLNLVHSTLGMGKEIHLDTHKYTWTLTNFHITLVKIAEIMFTEHPVL